MTEPPETAIDTLTGLWNHASISTLAPAASVAFVDLVRFRTRVNDAYGHAAGDRVLATVARRLREASAPNRVFRFGGDEYLIEIIQSLDGVPAIEMARQIGAIIAQPIDGINEPLEARIGIALGTVGRSVPVWVAATMLAHEAAGRDLPFVVDSQDLTA